jgi:hypothetical protein
MLNIVEILSVLIIIVVGIWGGNKIVTRRRALREGNKRHDRLLTQESQRCTECGKLGGNVYDRKTKTWWHATCYRKLLTP